MAAPSKTARGSSWRSLTPVTSVWGAHRVGRHLAPRGDLYSMGDSDPAATFGYVAEQLGARGLAFSAVRESVGPKRIGPDLKQKFGVYIANEGFSLESGNEAIAAGEADAVAFGKLFIANPDLPQRFAVGSPLNTPDPRTFYGSGPRGYTDYPSLPETVGSLDEWSSREPAAA